LFLIPSFNMPCWGLNNAPKSTSLAPLLIFFVNQIFWLILPLTMISWFLIIECFLFEWKILAQLLVVFFHLMLQSWFNTVVVFSSVFVSQCGSCYMCHIFMCFLYLLVI
jgi:hypothetical protein